MRSIIASTSVPLDFFFNDTATTEIYTLSLHDALPIYVKSSPGLYVRDAVVDTRAGTVSVPVLLGSQAHTSALQSLNHLSSTPHRSTDARTNYGPTNGTMTVPPNEPRTNNMARMSKRAR